MECAIIGIDGLDPGLIQRWKNELPNLSEFIQEGMFGKLNSSYPPLSSPAWPTLFTGKQGGKHGVFGFTKQKDQSHQWVPVNHSDIKTISLWELLDEENITVGVVNVPLTYPPSNLENGYIIAGWPIPNQINPATPPDIMDELEAKLGEKYKVHPFPMEPELKQRSPEETRGSIEDGLNHHSRAFQILADRYDVDVFFAVYMAIDHASHHLAYHEEELKKIYKTQDQALGELLSVLPETNIILISDHGHGAKGNLNFHTNEWLSQEGYLSKNEQTSIARGAFRTLGITQKNAIRVKNAIGIRDVRELLPQRVFDFLTRIIPPEDDRDLGFDSAAIEWTTTTAYSPLQNAIFIETERPEQNNELRDEIKNELESIPYPTDERDGELMTHVYTKDEMFSGPYLDDAPDIVFIADDMRCKANTGFANGEVITPQQWGEHRQYGVFITSGPQFETSTTTRQRDIKDIFPLVCALTDTPAPTDIDGDLPVERLEGEFELDFREIHPRPDDTTEYTDAETKDIQEQLESLGYLE